MARRLRENDDSVSRNGKDKNTPHSSVHCPVQSRAVVNKTLNINTATLSVIPRIPDQKMTTTAEPYLASPPGGREGGQSCPVVLSVDNCGGGGRCFG